MELVPFVEHGGLWVAAHPAAAHLVDVEAGGLVVVDTVDFLAATGFEHIGAFDEKVCDHLGIVVVVADRGDELGDSPLVMLIGAEADMVLDFGDRLALHAHGHEPGAGFGEGVFVGGADAACAGGLSAARGKVAHIAAAEAEFLVMEDVAERGDEDFRRAAAVVIFVWVAVEFGADGTPGVMECDIVAEDVVIVTEAVWKPAGS